MKKVRKRALKIFQFSIAIVGFCVIWEVVGTLGLFVNPLFLPPFTKVLAAFWKLTTTGALWAHASISLWRAVSGFVLGLAVAIPLGLALGWSRTLERYLNPLLQVFRNMPVLALLPVFVMFFGIGEVSKVAIIFWAVIWAVFISTCAGVKSVDPQLVKASRAMGTGSLRLFATVVFPAALPHIFTGIRLSATTSILVLVAAEMVGARRGLGYALNFYQTNMKIPEMYAFLLVMAIIGVAVNGTLELIEKRSFRWRGTQEVE